MPKESVARLFFLPEWDRVQAPFSFLEARIPEQRANVGASLGGELRVQVYLDIRSIDGP